MKLTWQKDPEKRPSFAMCLQRLEDMKDSIEFTSQFISRIQNHAYIRQFISNSKSRFYSIDLFPSLILLHWVMVISVLTICMNYVALNTSYCFGMIHLHCPYLSSPPFNSPSPSMKKGKGFENPGYCEDDRFNKQSSHSTDYNVSSSDISSKITFFV